MPLFKAVTISVMLILPSLIRMDYKPFKVIVFFKRLIKHIIYLFEIWRSGYVVRYYLAVEHIKKRRQIQLCRTYIYLCHISELHPKC